MNKKTLKALIVELAQIRREKVIIEGLQALIKNNPEGLYEVSITLAYLKIVLPETCEIESYLIQELGKSYKHFTHQENLTVAFIHAMK